MKLQLGVGTKVTLVFILFAALVLVARGWLFLNSGQAALRTAAFAELQSTALEKESAYRDWIAESQSDLALLGRSPEFIRQVQDLAQAALPAERGAGHGAVVEALRHHTGPEGAFLSLLILDPKSGLVLAANDSAEEGRSRATEPHFIEGRQRPYVQNLFYSDDLQQLAMAVAMPLVSPQGEALAVLVGYLNLDEMRAIIARRSALRETDDAYLLNEASQLITQPRFATEAIVLQQSLDTEARWCAATPSGSTRS